MISAGDINELINFFSFTVWIFYGLAMAALIVMRRTKPDAPRPYKVRSPMRGGDHTDASVHCEVLTLRVCWFGLCLLFFLFALPGMYDWTFLGQVTHGG